MGGLIIRRGVCGPDPPPDAAPLAGLTWANVPRDPQERFYHVSSFCKSLHQRAE